jgi:hypothetical protein
MAKVWAILNDQDHLLAYEEAESADEAVSVFAEKNGIPPEDARWLYAIPGGKVRDDVEIPGWLLSALEYGPEFAFGPRESSPEEWGECEKALAKLRAKGIHPEDIVGWVRIDSVFDAWAPVVK